MLSGIINSKSKTFLAFCFSFLAGNIIFSIIDTDIDYSLIYFALFTIIGLFIIFRKEKIASFILLCCLFFVIAVLRLQISIPTDSISQISHYNSQKMRITGYISAEPDIRTDGVRYIMKVEKSKDKSKLNGNVYFKSALYPRFNYGDRIKIDCLLKKPEPIETESGIFHYDKYLARYGVYSICTPGNITKLNGSGGSVVLKSIFDLKNIVASKINKLWHEPHASFMAGLLYGYRGGLGSLNEMFSRTGVTHIIAISGYNITIIATILMAFCMYLFIPRKRAFWLITFGIIVFVIFAGASASVVRAGIMGIIVLIAKQMGRSSRVGNVIVLTAVVMALQNPFILIWDAGFQLSFVSTLGLVYLSPILMKRLKKLPDAFGIKESFVSTISAIIATLPLILYQFGRLSIVAPIVNMLILWTLPWIMLLGFISVVFSFVFTPIAHVIAWLAWLGLSYIIIVVTFFSELSFASVDFRISLFVAVLSYVALGYVVYKFRKL